MLFIEVYSVQWVIRRNFKDEMNPDEGWLWKWYITEIRKREKKQNK